MLLDKGWKLRLTKPDGSVTETGASVPGCVTTDLIKSGVIDYDVFWRDNADRIQWIEDCDAEYTCEFVSDSDSPAELIFHGLDTYAEIYLNGVMICSADDMFVKHRADVSRILKKGINCLRVCFESPVKNVAGKPVRDAAFTYERLYTRRIQCTYGWDWVNRFVTMGIWKPVELRRINADRMPPGNEGIYISTLGINRYSAQIFVRLDFESFSGDEYAEITVSDPEGNPVTVRKRRIMSGFVEEYLDIPSPRLWWPNGYGAQPLYTLAVIFGGERKVQKFGIRTVSILEFADAPGSDGRLLSDRLKSFPHLKEWDRNETTSCFTLLVNGVKIFCQGGCWVPCEPFPSSESDEKIRSVVGLARLGNVNMIRVWGGGIFEHESFYDACDENGILVTQDFLMACGNYPEEDDGFIEHLKNETEEGARLLRNHPCLVWWTGDNENAVRGSENDVYYTGKRAALDGIAPVLKALDPCRRFLPSSPYGGVPFASATAGTTHNTN
ncbi:MAG: hypothetical protein IKS28_05455, partial [Clostridia bacterium]|nr:hypothetical protein [Clostridia bacterium]